MYEYLQTRAYIKCAKFLKLRFISTAQSVLADQEWNIIY